MTEHLLEPGEIICYEGDRGDTMYLIRAGKVLVVKGRARSHRRSWLTGDRERLIGEMALLENQPRSATNIAIDQVRLLQINREEFPAVGEQQPGYWHDHYGDAQRPPARVR